MNTLNKVAQLVANKRAKQQKMTKEASLQKIALKSRSGLISEFLGKYGLPTKIKDLSLGQKKKALKFLAEQLSQHRKNGLPAFNSRKAYKQARQQQWMDYNKRLWKLYGQSPYSQELIQVLAQSPNIRQLFNSFKQNVEYNYLMYNKPGFRQMYQANTDFGPFYSHGVVPPARVSQSPAPLEFPPVPVVRKVRKVINPDAATSSATQQVFENLSGGRPSWFTRHPILTNTIVGGGSLAAGFGLGIGTATQRTPQEILNDQYTKVNANFWQQLGGAPDQYYKKK